MKWRPANPRTFLRLVAAAILLAGLVSAGAVYLAVKDAPENPWVEEIRNSKLYRRDLELYGGKLSIVGSDLSEWFAGLWHGRTLSFTIASLSGFTSVVLFVVASHLRPAPDSARADDRH